MNQVNGINIDDPAGKTVGITRPASALAATDGLQKSIKNQFKVSGQRLPPKGVYRFHSHEEADEWMAKHTDPIKS